MPPIIGLKPVEWISSTREDLQRLPEAVQYEFGYALYQAQVGKHHVSPSSSKANFVA